MTTPLLGVAAVMGLTGVICVNMRSAGLRATGYMKGAAAAAGFPVAGCGRAACCCGEKERVVEELWCGRERKELMYSGALAYRCGKVIVGKGVDVQKGSVVERDAGGEKRLKIEKGRNK